MWARLLAVALIGTVSVSARADEPDAAAVQRAADQLDEGLRTLHAEHYEAAASHFEAAYQAVPSARALRNAMRSRDAAGQPARAATLAALAKDRYPSDVETVKLADEILAKTEGDLARIAVRCAKPCLLAVGKRLVAGGTRATHVLYLPPGEAKLRASFKDSGHAENNVVVKVGDKLELDFEPPAARVAEPEPQPEPAPAPEIVAPPPKAPQEPRAWYRSPALFYVSLGATGVLTGVTIWSGVDTLNNPGKEAVRAACAGQGTDCPEYQLGVGKQIRTNALIGASAGMGLVTVLIGAIVTDFSSRRPVDMSLSIAPDGPSASLRGSF